MKKSELFEQLRRTHLKAQNRPVETNLNPEPNELPSKPLKPVEEALRDLEEAMGGHKND